MPIAKSRRAEQPTKGTGDALGDRAASDQAGA